MNSRSPIRLFVTLGLVLLVCGSGLAGRAAAQVQYRTLAFSGQPAPSTPAGIRYSNFGSPVLNDVGQAAYLTGLAGTGMTSDVALYAGPLTAPQLVARAADSAPGAPAGVKYGGFYGSPVLNDAGHTAYYAGLIGSGGATPLDIAIYAGLVDAPQLVARTGDAAAGTPAGVKYSPFDVYPLVLNDTGQKAYRAVLTGSHVTTLNDGAIYAGPLATPQLVAREGDAAPGVSVGVKYDFLGTPILNDGGLMAYYTSLTGSGVTAENNRAIYAGLQTAPKLVARTGDAAPGMPAGVSYSGFIDTAFLNDANQIAYSVLLAGSGITSSNRLAIYAGPLAAPQLMVRTGDPAPGVPAGVNYASFLTLNLSDAGQVAYLAVLTGSGVTSVNDRAIYAGPLTAPQLVARTGTAAPGTPGGVSYAIFEAPALNDVGQAAYFAGLTGSGVTDANNRGLFFSDPALGGLLVAREGDLFDVGGGNLRTIANFGIDFLVGRGDDTPTGLSNDGTLAFGLRFTDGTSGIFTATIIPEPAGLALLALAGLMLVGCRSALRRRML